ncbi:MAG: hypothetical protein F4Y26_04615 [Gammaproteobacteria bacterium]|nr:hypothetical protein [Gammaproteobacteria bacterium]
MLADVHATDRLPEAPALKAGELVECTACGHPCHVKAKTCPNCGKRKPTQGRRKSKSNPWVVAGGFAVIAVAVLLGSQDDDNDGGDSSEARQTAGQPPDSSPLTDSPVANDPPAMLRRDASTSNASDAMEEGAARAKAARVVTESGRRLFGNGFGSGIATQAGGKWYFRVRARDDAYLVVVWNEGATIRTCRQARAEGLGCDEEAKWLSDTAATSGSQTPLTAPTGDCHMAAMGWAKVSGATVEDVLNRVAAGNDRLASATACTNDRCLLEKLSSACTSYCEAVGVFATLMEDDRARGRYGDVYDRFAELSVHCDSAKIQAQAGAWDNVPFFLDLARAAVGELEVKAQFFR